MTTWYETPKRSKYGSAKTVVDGITFDSRKEARRYAELKILEKVGRIEDLRLQPEYELIPKYRKNGHTIRRTTYRADFAYIDTETGQLVVEDVKGFRTETYRLKKKLLEYLYPEITLTEL